MFLKIASSLWCLSSAHAPSSKPQVPARESDLYQGPRGALRFAAPAARPRPMERTQEQMFQITKLLLNGASNWLGLFTARENRRLGRKRALLFCCAWLTLRCYRLKLCCREKNNSKKKKVKKRKAGGCKSSDCEGLLQRVNIGVAHIFQEKRAESPTQTSL